MCKYELCETLLKSCLLPTASFENHKYLVAHKIHIDIPDGAIFCYRTLLSGVIVLPPISNILSDLKVL